MYVARLSLSLAFAVAFLAACSPQQSVNRAAPAAMKVLPMPGISRFTPQRPAPVRRSNASIARDFLDLTFHLETGRDLPVLSRFEGPITVAVVGPVPASLPTDLGQLLARLQSEAGLDIRMAQPRQPASITVQTVPRTTLRRFVPQAACFVAPNVSSWDEYRRSGNSAKTDWTTIVERKRMAVFLPGDVSPQEIRDCLHEELAQSLGPLNDLYRLSDSIFNDDNFNVVLTGFDMLILRAYNDPELHSGMGQDEVAARLPALLNRLHPSGRSGPNTYASDGPPAWNQAVAAALSVQSPENQRPAAARRALGIARDLGWSDNRLAFSLYIFGRMTISDDANTALSAFQEAEAIYLSQPETHIHAAHVAVQISAFALSAGQPEAARRIADANIPAAIAGENAGLLATLLMIKAQALDLLDRTDEARVVRLDSLGWALYGFGSENQVRRHLAEIAALAPPNLKVVQK